MQTYIQYRVCEGPLPALGTLRHFAVENNPTCFLVAPHGVPGAKVNADDLLSFLETFADTAEKLQVLLFWSRHPNARCTLDSIYGAPEAGRLDLRRAVRELIHQGVMTEYMDDCLTLYSLTSDPDKRGSVENLGRLTWDQVRFWNEYRIVELSQAQASS